MDDFTSLSFLQSYQAAQSILNTDTCLVTEADIEKYIKKASSDCATKITAMDNLKTKLSNSNSQYLELYKDKAKNINPIGLVCYNFKYPMIDTVSKRSSHVFEMIKQKEDESLKLDNIPDLKKWIEDNITNNAIYDKIFELLYNNSKGRKDINQFIKVEKAHNITKSDIIRAIKNLETCDEDIDKLEKLFKDLDIDYKTKLQSYDNGIRSGILDSTLDEYHQTIEANCIALKRIASNEIYKIYMKLFKVNQKTDRVILKKAANYNPQNIRETSSIQEQIDIDYELSFYDE